MKFPLFVLSILASTLVFSSCEECRGPKNKDCICTMDYNPVCGCDGQTYGNACAAACEGVTDYVPGECSGRR